MSRIDRIFSGRDLLAKIVSTRPSVTLPVHAGTSTEVRVEKKLPPEIWLLIEPWLPLSDRGALALTCRYLYATLGSSSLKVMAEPNNRKEKLKLLFRLHEDFPSHYLCEKCVRYHSNSLAYWDWQPPYTALWLYPGCAISFQELTAAMTAHRANPGSSVSQLDKTGSPVLLGSIFWMASTTFNASDGRLLARIELSTPVAPKLLQQKTIPCLPLCSHLPRCTALFGHCSELLSVVPMPWDDIPDDFTAASSPLYRCTLCPQEFLLNVRRIRDRRVSEQVGARVLLHFIRYIDFGECYSRHSIEWNALVRRQPEGLAPSVPYDVGIRETICRRVLSQRYPNGHTVTGVDDALPLFNA